MRLLNCLLIALIATLSSASAEVQRADIPAKYGCRMPYLAGPLKYPNFTIHFVERGEFHLAGTRLSTTSYTFEVLDGDKIKLSDFAFTMSGFFENTAEFMAGGKKYVAEMFYSTGHPPNAGENAVMGDVNLTEKEIIVWDEATAKQGNSSLREIWKNNSKPRAQKK